MRISAILNDDGTFAASYGEPGNMTSFEGQFTKAELRFITADGGIDRLLMVPRHGVPVVEGPNPAPAVEATATLDGEHPVGVEAHGESVPGGTHEVADRGTGFASFTKADEVTG